MPSNDQWDTIRNMFEAGDEMSRVTELSNHWAYVQRNWYEDGESRYREENDSENIHAREENDLRVQSRVRREPTDGWVYNQSTEEYDNVIAANAREQARVHAQKLYEEEMVRRKEEKRKWLRERGLDDSGEPILTDKNKMNMLME